ncbi:MAG: SDR family NAD(P)-dependent oxidoreductase [Bacteroidales bacterium]|jgi:NADP-dependent 3-hydroxy acid dehydrogenase YdfG|nr:SDR family NAD(P)-dependent oxidoreductase [Bacteroidales bacterium]
MNNLTGKTVLITGAGSGIGKAAAVRFAQESCKVIICARNIEKIEALAAELKEKYQADTYAFALDVRDKEFVRAVIESIPQEFRNIDILINNAGLALGLEKFSDNLVEDWEEMIDTNITGLLYVTREILPIMLHRRQGQIINVGSIAGIHAYPNGAVYCATKAAVKTLTDGLRQDLVETPIRVTNIQPGMVETNFSVVRFHGDKKRAGDVYKGIEPLTGEDIADIIAYAAVVPAHVQICEITVTPTNQATGNIVYKKR